MTEWQSIETAPKDGTPVLVFGSRRYTTSGRKEFVLLDRAEIAQNSFDEDWCDEDVWTVSGDSYGDEIIPTHWQPLPKPPQVERRNALAEGADGRHDCLQSTQPLDVCPKCGGDADNGFDRSWPDPVPYWCTKCTGEDLEGVSEAAKFSVEPKYTREQLIDIASGLPDDDYSIQSPIAWAVDYLIEAGALQVKE